MKRALSAAGALILAASIGWSSQKIAKPPKRPPRTQPAPEARMGGRGAGRRGAGRINNPLNPASRFLNMTPEQQQRVLDRATPPQRQRMLQALDRWNSMRPAQKEFISRQYQALSRLPPGQQLLVTREMNAFNRLTEDRRRPVRAELIRLLRMPPEQRPARFSSPQFMRRYSPPEQQILRGLSTNLPDDYPLAGK